MTRDRDARARPSAAHAGTLAVFAAAFLYRWITIDFDNDYFMHVAWAAEMLRGEWPVRDFVEPGFALQTLLAWAGLRLGGYQLAWEAAIACTLLAASVALVYQLCRQSGLPRWLALLASAIALATFPRMYAYPKAFVYPLALAALVAYLRRPSLRTLLLVSAATAIAFLFRHDHGAWIAGPVVLALGQLHWRQPRTLVRAVALYGGAAALMAAPWLLWVAVSGHAGQYVDFLLGQGRGLTNATRLPAARLVLDRAQPIVTLAPIDYPVVGLRWSPGATLETRRQIASRLGLEPLAPETDTYRLTDVSVDNVRALVQDPLIEDTRGLDRGSLRVPSGALPWLHLRLQQYVPIVRLRILPGLVRAANAEAWLTWVTFLAPAAALGALTAGLLRRGARPAPETSILIATTALLSLITYQTLVRASPDSRLGDIVALTAVLVAWTAHRVSSLHGWPARVARAAAAVLLLVTLASAMVFGRVAPRLAAAGVDGPVNLARRAGGQAAIYGARPLDVYAPPGAQGLPAVARWLHACTRDGDRVSVVGFEPQLFVLAERGFAGGLAFYDLGWNSSARDQQLAIERWSRQRVPVVLALATEWESFSRDYTAIRAFIDRRYAPALTSDFGGGKQLTVLTGTAFAPVRTHEATGLPCWR